MTKSDENLIRSIPQALSVTERICSSVNVGSTKTGINMDAVRLSGEIVKATAEATKERILWGAPNLSSSATLRMTTRLWRELSSVLQRRTL